MPLTTFALNVAADELANRTLSVRLHSGDPGASGTDNRVGTVSQDVAASGWSAAASGSVNNTAAVDFGVLDADNDHTVSHYSLWDGSNFFARESFASSVTVNQGEEFQIAATSIALTGTTS